jgi:hypothetical protein
MLALRGTYSYADAYGVSSSPPHDGAHLGMEALDGGHRVQIGTRDITPTLTIPAYETNVTVVEVQFDETDIAGTFHEPGHPGVIGLWLNAYTEGDTIGGTAEVYALDLTTYVVPDLQADPGGFMYVRGFTWKAPQGKRPYP